MAQLSGFPLDLVTKVGGIIRKMTLDAKVRCPNFFRLDFTSGARTAQNLASIIKNLGPGLTEICTHPGNATERGMAELTALLSDEVKLAFSAGVALADYSILSSDGRAVS